MNKNLVISIILQVLLAGIYYYMFLPVINPTCFSFWVYVMALIINFSVITSIFTVSRRDLRVIEKIQDLPKLVLLPMVAIFVIITGIMVVNIVVSPIFNAKSYSQRITVDETGEFTKDIEEVDFKKVPLLDRDSTEKLGDRVMGQNSDYVSQFYVSDDYTQINYNDEILRVTTLEYDGLIKWITNREEGIKGYITVNSVNGESKLVKLEKGLKYMKSAFFNDNLTRKIRFQYPFTPLGESMFEIDNEGNPYYITPTLSYTGVTNKTKVTGAIITDPITGKSKKYDLKDIPTWVDNVYPAYLVLEQVNHWGTYRDGFINSIFGQKNVVNTTEGYNYLALNDDIYLYTGITSVLSDESNLGFILTNLRTGETRYYDLPGAEEYSAMDSAQGQVQQMKYVSTFPLLINLNGKPTYLVSLKDNAGLVKMYGFVDVKDYQKVVVTDASLGIQKAMENYLNSNSEEIADDLLNKKTITVRGITNAVIDSNTYYYIVDENNQKYMVPVKVSNKLPFVKEGDNLTIMYYKDAEIIEITKID